MGTIIDPTAIRAQSDGIVRALTAQNSTLKNVLPSISNFQNEPELGGAAWSGLKSHIGGHRSVIQGLICANEEVINDSEELVVLSGDEKLDEDKIKAEIEVLKSQNRGYGSSVSHYAKSLVNSVVIAIPMLVSFNRGMMSYYSSLIAGNNKAIAELEKKLVKIAKIISSTSSLYRTSESLYSDVETGMQQLGTSGSGGVFTGIAGGTWQTRLDNSMMSENSLTYIVENMPKKMTPEETENWLVENLKMFGPDFLDYLKEGTVSAISYRNGRAFLNGVAISQDSLGRLKCGNRYLFKPGKNGGHTYSLGKDFQNKSEIDLGEYHYSKLPNGKFDFSEMRAAGLSGFKDAFNPTNDFKGWGDASKVGKLGKGLGILGTGLTIGNNFADNIDLSDGLSVGESVNFVTDTAINIGSGAGASAIGAMVGSVFLPPLGTVVGAGVGIGVNVLINHPLGNPPKSTVDHVKDAVKNVTKGIGDKISSLVGGLSFGFGG